MRFGTVDGRFVLVARTVAALDVATASGGRFAARRSRRARALGRGAACLGADGRLVDTAFDGPRRAARPPVPEPRQVFADRAELPPHAAEAGFAAPGRAAGLHQVPVLHHGPGHRRSPARRQRRLGDRGRRRDRPRRLPHPPRPRPGTPSPGSRAARTSPSACPSCRARRRSSRLAKSYPGFGPTGPGRGDPGRARRPRRPRRSSRSLDGEVCSTAGPAEMIFPVDDLVARLSAVCPLLPGRPHLHRHAGGGGEPADPAAVPAARRDTGQPVEGIGEIRQHFTNWQPSTHT